MKNKNYPNHAFKSKKLWLRDVRKRWAAIRKFIQHNNESIRMGLLYLLLILGVFIILFHFVSNFIKLLTK